MVAEVVEMDIHDASLTAGMSVLVMMAAAVDTHDGSVDTEFIYLFVGKGSGQPTISLEMPVPSRGHYGFHSFPVVD
jgi:hypothetical protein